MTTNDDYTKDQRLIEFRLDSMKSDITEIKADVKEIRDIVTLGRIKLAGLAATVSLIVAIIVTIIVAVLT